MRATVSLARAHEAEPVRDQSEQLVTGVVAESVVDVLEAVEVEEEYGGARAVAATQG